MLSVPGHVHWARCDDGGTAVLDLRTGTWHMFSGTGARIWDAITLRGGVDGLAEEIAIPYGYDLGTTRNAVETYVMSLLGMGLLTAATRPTRPTRPRKRRWRR